MGSKRKQVARALEAAGPRLEAEMERAAEADAAVGQPEDVAGKVKPWVQIGAYMFLRDFLEALRVSRDPARTLGWGHYTRVEEMLERWRAEVELHREQGNEKRAAYIEDHVTRAPGWIEQRYRMGVPKPEESKVTTAGRFGG